MIEAMSIQYQINDLKILKNLNFLAQPGQFISIVGPNGAGKSTLLNLLANELETKNENVIVFKEKLLSKWCLQELPYHKAKFSQYYVNDIPLLVKEVVMMGRYPYFHAKPSLEDWHIVEDVMRKTDVFPLKERDYNTLSGGEKQRVHLCRALAQLENELEKKVLFLDEPLNNLDIKHQYKTLQLIKEFSEKGNSAVVVLHDLNMAATFSDHIFLMKNGSLVCEGLPEEVIEKEKIQEVYGFPCAVCKNPVNEKLLILFG